MTKKRRFPIPTRKRPPPREIPPFVTRRRLRRNVGALLGLLTLTIMVFVAGLAPWIAPHDPLAVAPEAQLKPPNAAHWAGTDLLGRDVFSRLLFGGRVSLWVGVVAVLIASVPGTALGLIAGYYRSWIDSLIMRVMDLMLSFPGILLALGIVALLGPGLLNVMIAVGIAGIPSYTRLVRGSVLAVKKNLYVRAARTIGCRDGRILLRHVLPNVLAPIVVLTTLDIAWAILNASSLSFLGLGAQPPTPEWGAMLSEGRGFMYQAPWITMAPGLAIMLTVLSVNLLGDGLRDALDPRLRTR
ncbi:MAG: ABC transporter permease [Anaerolineales bacterium]|nr:MAG: ABC transporter permease [Anaerolineales bacterium]